jgi:hypothetical protein
MRTIIAGSRTIDSVKVVRDAMKFAAYEENIVPTKVVSGVAMGIDKCGIVWAEEQGLPVARFPALWDKYGKRAGYVRNAQMADNADALVAIWDGRSKGTNHMINIARSRNLKIFIFFVNQPEDCVWKKSKPTEYIGM